MYKKIYSNIRALVIFTLAITSLLFVTAYFALYSSSYKDELKNEALYSHYYCCDFFVFSHKHICKKSYKKHCCAH